MSIIVETGAIVANANSYISLAFARDYALARGTTLSADDSALEILFLKSMDWIEAKRKYFKGSKVEDDQPLQWPRKDVYIDNVLIAENYIPVELQKIQCELIIALHNGNNLYPDPPNKNKVVSGPITRRVVGPIQTHYLPSNSSIGLLPDGSYMLPSIKSLMDAICANSFSLSTVRL